jgi:hypothetical protein
MNDLTEGREVLTVESGTVAQLNKSEIDQAIATAHQYPRSISAFRKEMLQMVTLTEKVAGECIYALPRDGKVIEGPSARFAEVAASAWRNVRAGARIVNEGMEFVTAQGVFHDLERNVAITYEVQRRITGRDGRRFKPDMIGVTANAACSVALRNAILKGIPKAFWAEMYDAARHASVGDVKSIANKRADAVKAFAAYNIGEAQILKRLGRAGVQDITIDDLINLAGFLTAIKEGDSTPEQVFGEVVASAPTGAIADINSAVKAKPAPVAEDRPPLTLDGEALGPSYGEVRAYIDKAKHPDDIDAAEAMIDGLPDQFHAELHSLASERRKNMQ